MTSYRVSGYSSTAIQSRPWTSTEAPAKKPEKMPKALKTTIEPRFLEFAEMYKDEPLLYETFKNAAVGKFPSGFVYKDNQLIFKHRKAIKYLPLHKDSRQAARKCVEFMQNGGIFTKSKEDIKTLQPDPIEGEIRKKVRLKDELVRKFVHCHMRSKHKLSDAEELDLLDVVITGFILDQFVFEDIQLGEKGVEVLQIVKLHGLDEDHFTATGEWRINPALQNRKSYKRKQYKKRIIKKTEAPPTSVEYMWDKHLINMTKKNKDDEDDESLLDA